jgi:hypothetical protein
VLDHVTTYTLPGDPYAHLLTAGGARASQMITPEEVAAGIADAAEAPQLPLRIPLGRTACAVLAARRAAPDDRPFIPGESTAVPATDVNSRDQGQSVTANHGGRNQG